MISNMELVSLCELSSMIGGQHFSTAALLQKISNSDDNLQQEALAFEILERRKSLYQFSSALRKCWDITDVIISDDDIQDIIRINAALVSCCICNVSETKHMHDFQQCVIAVIRSKKYKVDQLKLECDYLLNDTTPSEFLPLLTRKLFVQELNYDDVLPVFLECPSAFTRIYSVYASRWIHEIENELASIELNNLMDVVFNVCKKKALSSYIKMHDPDIALGVYVECFKRILTYEPFDYERYIDLACDSLVNLEEVIT